MQSFLKAAERRIRLLAVLLESCRTHEQTGGLYLGLQVGHLELGILELRYRLAELLALHGVLDGLIQSALSYSEGLRGDADTTSVEGLHGYREAPSYLAEQIALGDAAVGEDSRRR